MNFDNSLQLETIYLDLKTINKTDSDKQQH